MCMCSFAFSILLKIFWVNWGQNQGGKKASVISKNEFAVLSKALVRHSGRTESSRFIAQTERRNDPTMGGIV